MNIIDIFLIFIMGTLLTSHIGIAWSGILLQKGNLLEDLPEEIEKVKSNKLQNLMQCPRCISGQFALWSYVGVSIYFGLFHWFLSIIVGIAWVCWIIAMTAWFYKIYGYK